MPRVLNVSKGTVVAEDVAVARSLWSRFRGLMLRREMASEQGLLLEPSGSVHTAFMRFPIDVVFLDREKQVIKVAANVRPFRVALSRGHSALELNAGSAGKASVVEGDRLVVTDQPENGRVHDQSRAAASEKQEARV
jgi:uncharacterized membrane protein (UPF0127 family)